MYEMLFNMLMTAIKKFVLIISDFRDILTLLYLHIRNIGINDSNKNLLQFMSKGLLFVISL